MLRKAFAGLLSALLIGAASLAPSVVNAQSVNGPDQNNTLIGNFANYGYGQSADYGNPGGNSGGAWYGDGGAMFTAVHSGTVNTLWEYASCGRDGAGVGGTCATDTVTLGIYTGDTNSATLNTSCNVTYPGATAGWIKCTLSSPVTVTKGNQYWISSNVNASAGDQAMHYGIGRDAATSNGTNLGCTHTGTLSPNPPTTMPALSSTGCPASYGTSVDAVAATGAFSDVINIPVPAAGVTSGQNHTTTVGGHKVQLYRFTNVPGSVYGQVVDLIEFFADSTTAETTGWNGAIYVDSSDTPTTLLAQCNGGTMQIQKGQWNSCTVTPFALASGQNYWLAIWNADATNNLIVDDQTNGSINTECLTSSAQTAPFSPSSAFVTTGDSVCTNKFGLVNAGPLT